MVEKCYRDDGTIETAYCRSPISISNSTMSTSSDRNEILDAACVITTDGSLLRFGVEDECDEMPEPKLRAPNKGSFLQATKEKFKNHYFDEFFA